MGRRGEQQLVRKIVDKTLLWIAERWRTSRREFTTPLCLQRSNFGTTGTTTIKSIYSTTGIVGEINLKKHHYIARKHFHRKCSHASEMSHLTSMLHFRQKSKEIPNASTSRIVVHEKSLDFSKGNLSVKIEKNQAQALSFRLETRVLF